MPRTHTERRQLPSAELAQRFFWPHVDQSGGPDACWPWRRSLSSTGYGQLNSLNLLGRWATHVLAYELSNGPIPGGLFLDHTCHNSDLECDGGKRCPHRRCCNPAHLQAVTNEENVERSARPRQRGKFVTHCPHGHEYTPENTGRSKTGRYCRACLRDRAYLRKRGVPRPGPADQSLSRAGTRYCSRGHDYEITARYDTTTGKRRCRDCERQNDQNAKARAKA